ncbi:citrate transporter [Myxococcota bacterium]|nr:citrate transporter [Myxococcota bacterium]
MTFTLIVFAIVYLGMMMGSLPGLRVDRAAIALLGAIALLASGEVQETAALASIDFGTIGLLFGLMIVSANFNLAGLYSALAERVRTLKLGPRAFLALVILFTGVMSAFLTNDVIAVALAPVLLQVCVVRRLNPIPFLLALAFSANAGSIATIIGSPQNMLIGEHFNLSFAAFMGYTALPAFFSLAVIWGVLALQYNGDWTGPDQAENDQTEPMVPLDSWEATKGVVVTLAVIIIFLFAPWPRSLVALTAGGLLLANAHFRSQAMLDRVDWQLLILFIGLFIVNGALQATHLPAEWITMLREQGVNLQSPPWIFAATVILSDIVSNVPSVMLLLPFATEPASAPVMAIASGLSSNLIVIGSLASIIVVDAAARRGIRISAMKFMRSGVPITLISLALSALWLWLIV